MVMYRTTLRLVVDLLGCVLSGWCPSGTVGSGGSFGANPMEQHIGLGKTTGIESLEIWWPASNTRQTFSAVAKGQFIEIKELAKNYTVLERRPFRLGGKR